MVWQKLMWLAAAGAAGTLARFGIQTVAQRWLGSSFPWGTLVVNLAGCLAFGFVWALAEGRLAMNTHARSVILVGFMGAFTTFSTFAFESGELLRDARWCLALMHMLGHVLLGTFFVFVGAVLGRGI